MPEEMNTTPAPAEQSILGGTPPATPAQDATQNTPPATPAQHSETTPPATPESYQQFQVPEGFGYDEGKVTEFSALAKELNLSQDQAQKLISLHTKQFMDHEQHIREVEEDWKKQTKNHPEFGGQKFEQSLSDAMKFVNQFGGDELKVALDQTGAGNHPAIFAAFAKAGRLISEDQLVSGETRSPGGSSFSEVAKQMYPGM